MSTLVCYVKLSINVRVNDYKQLCILYVNCSMTGGI